MDPTTAVALAGVLTAVVTTSGGVAIAVVTNRRERENAAIKAAEAQEDRAESAKVEALEGRLLLRDEQIALQVAQIAHLRAEIARLKKGDLG